MSSPTSLTREETLGFLARAARDDVRAAADAILQEAKSTDTPFAITRSPEAGVVTAQVREPLARHRFLLGDVLATQAEVTVDGTPGWGMCFGDDRATALALAVCDAEVARSGPRASAVAELAQATADELKRRRAAEWERLVPTIVEFEEIS